MTPDLARLASALELNATEPHSSFVIRCNLRHHKKGEVLYQEQGRLRSSDASGASGRGLHSSTFRLHVSTLCGYVVWSHKVSVTKTAQVELRSGRV
jgi:hypothetical protein